MLTLFDWTLDNPQIIPGYRELPYVKDNPEWYVLELLDGFGSHTNSLAANELRTKHKVLSLKEEADSSHINQAYDRLTAKSDKRVHRESLAWLLQDRARNKNILDQYALVHCGLAAVRKTKANPEIWRKSFVSTNTKPDEMISFVDWCKKVEGLLQGSDSYDLIQQNMNVDKYTLLPAMWQAMTPAEKRKAVEVVAKHGGNAWGLECCQELSKELKVPFKDLTVLQPCIFCAIDDPSHLDRGLESSVVKAPSPEALPTEVVAAEETRKSANDGLTMFQRYPSHLKGEELFDHSIGFMHRQYAKKEDDFKISAHLNVASPANQHQKDLLTLDYHLKMQGSLMADVNAGVNLRKAAQCRLDNLGQIKSRSAFINDPTRLQRMQSRLELQKSLGRVDEIAEVEAAEKQRAAMIDLEPLVLEAITMYEAGQTSHRDFTKDKCKALLSVVFGVSFKKTAKKDELVKLVEESAAKNPDKLTAAAEKFRANNDAPVPDLPEPETDLPSTPSPTHSPTQDYTPSPTHLEFNPDESPAPEAVFEVDAASARLWPRWLYDQCKLTSERDGVKWTALEIALKVLLVVAQARKMIEKESYNPTALSGMLFQSVKGAYTKGVDRDFIFTVMDEMEEMADSSLSESDLQNITL